MTIEEQFLIDNPTQTVGKTNPVQTENGAPVQAIPLTSDSSGDSSNGPAPEIAPTVPVTEPAPSLVDAPQPQTGTVDAPPGEYTATTNTPRVTQKQFDDDQRKAKVRKDPVVAYNDAVNKVTKSFPKEIEFDKDYQLMKSSAENFAKEDIKGYVQVYADEYGYGSDAFWEALNEKYNAIYNDNVTKLGLPQYVAGKYDEAVVAAGHEVGEDVLPDWAHGDFGREFYRTMAVRFPKGYTGFERLANSQEFSESMQFIDNYERKLKDGTLKPDQMVGVVQGSYRGTGPGTVPKYKDMTVTEALEHYKAKALKEAGFEEEMEKVAEEYNIIDKAIESGYDLEDGVSFDDIPGLLGSSLPYMALAVLGTAPIAVVESGNLYSDNLDELARMKCQCQNPDESVYLQLIEDKEDGGAAALIGGSVVAQLEKIGVGKMFKGIWNVNTIKALLRGEYKKFSGALAYDTFQGTFGEWWTESLQQFTEQATGSAITGKNKFDLKEIVQAGKAGGLLGLVISGPVNIISSAKAKIAYNGGLLEIPELGNAALDNLGLAGEHGQGVDAYTSVQTTVKNKRSLNKVFGTNEEAFHIANEVKLAGLAAQEALAITPEDKAKIKEAQYQQLDLAEAFYTINSKENSHIKGRAKKAAGRVLYERNQLARQATSGTGLDTNNKERIKILDEKLNAINSRAKRGYTSSILEKVRKIVGPKRSVGAARAETPVQKVISRLDDLLSKGVSMIDAIDRIDDAVTGTGLTEQRKVELIEQLKKIQPKYDESGIGSLIDYIATDEEARGLYQEGETSEKIDSETIKSQEKSKPAIRTVSELISDMSNMYTSPEAKGRIVGDALAQKAKNDKLKQANHPDIKNQTWATDTIKQDTKLAESAIGGTSKAKDSDKGNVVKALNDFTDMRNVIDAAVAREEGAEFDKAVDRAFKLDQEAAELEGTPKKRVEAALKKEISRIKDLYANGLMKLENKVAKEVAKTNTPPPYFRPFDNDQGRAIFVLEFKNKFGNDIIYNMFPENGQANFEALKPRQWADLMVKFNRWQNSGKDGDKAKVQQQIDGYVKKGIVANVVKIDEASKRRAARNARKTEAANEVKNFEKGIIEKDTSEVIKAIDEFKKEVEEINSPEISKLISSAGFTRGLQGYVEYTDERRQEVIDAYMKKIGKFREDGNYDSNDFSSHEISEIDSFQQNLTSKEITRDRKRIIEAIGAPKYKRLLLKTYTTDTADHNSFYNEMAIHSKDVKIHKTTIDKKFDELLEKIKNPDGTVTLYRTVSRDVSIPDPDIGASWTIDPRFSEEWKFSLKRAFPNKRIFEAKIDVKLDDNFLTVGDWAPGQTQTEIVFINKGIQGKNASWTELGKDGVIDRGVFKHELDPKYDRLVAASKASSEFEASKKGKTNSKYGTISTLEVEEKLNKYGYADDLETFLENKIVWDGGQALDNLEGINVSVNELLVYVDHVYYSTYGSRPPIFGEAVNKLVELGADLGYIDPSYGHAKARAKGILHKDAGGEFVYVYRGVYKSSESQYRGYKDGSLAYESTGINPEVTFAYIDSKGDDESLIDAEVDANEQIFEMKVYLKDTVSNGVYNIDEVIPTVDLPAIQVFTLKEVKEALRIANTLEATEIAEKLYSPEENAKAEIRLSQIIKDPSIELETEILYEKAYGNGDIDALVSDYAAIAGRHAATGFVESLNHINFGTNTNFTPAIAKLDLLQQLLYNQTDGSIADAVNLSDPLTVEITAAKARMAQVQQEQLKAPDGPAKVALRNRFFTIQRQLNELEKGQRVTKGLPSMEHALEGDNEASGFPGALNLAAAAVRGNTRGISEEAKAKVELGSLPAQISIERLQDVISVFEDNSKQISSIIEKQVQNSNQIKVLGVGKDVKEALKGSQENDIENIVEQSNALNPEKLALRDVQVDAARIIAGVEKGLIKVPGLKKPISEIKLKSYYDGSVPKNTNPRIKAKIKHVTAKIAKIKIELEKAKAIINTEGHEYTNKEVDNYGKLLNDESLAIFELDGLISSVEVQNKIGKLKLDGLPPNPNLQFDEATKQKIKLIEEDAIKEYSSLTDEMYNIDIDNTSSLGYDNDLRKVTPENKAAAVSAALQSLYTNPWVDESDPDSEADIETDGLDTNATVGGFLGVLSNQLGIEDKTSAMYGASKILGKLQQLGIVDLSDPVYFKDQHKVEVIDVDAMDNIIFGHALKMMELGKSQIKTQQRVFSQPQYGHISNWKTDRHPDGSKQLKIQTEADRMNIKDSPNVFKIQNIAKNVALSSNLDVINTYKAMLLMKHPAFTGDNKNYTKDQKKGIARNLKTITRIGDDIGDRIYRSNAKYGSRGRLYSTIALFNHQAAKEAASAIQLGFAKPIGDVGWKWLLADVAESAGLTAGTLEELQKGTLDNLEDFIDISNDVIGNADRIFGNSRGEDAMDNPPGFLAGVLELRKALQHAKIHGDVTTYRSKYVPYIDATVSGAQNIGSLISSRAVMEWVNGLPGPFKKDLYSEVFANLVDRGIIITEDHVTKTQKEFFDITNHKLQEFTNQIKNSKKEYNDAKYGLIDKIKKENPPVKHTKNTPTSVRNRIDLDHRKKLSGIIRVALQEFREENLKYRVTNPDFGKDNKATQENPGLAEQKYLQANKFDLLKEQQEFYKQTVDMNLYNSIFWGQPEWLERSRTAGKKPVMTDNYNASPQSMAAGLLKEFSAIKGVKISPSNTRWIADRLVESNQQIMNPIFRFKEAIKNLAESRAMEGTPEVYIDEDGKPQDRWRNGKDLGWVGKFSQFVYKRRYREPKILQLQHQNFGDPKNISNLSVAIGDTDIMDMKRIRNGAVANITHTLDKEIVAWMHLNFKHNDELLTIHDAFGTSLSNMDELYHAVREAHAALYNGDTFLDILRQNTNSEAEAQEIFERIYVGDYDVDLIKDSQAAYGKSGKIDKKKLVQSLKDRGDAYQEKKAENMQNSDTGSVMVTDPEGLSSFQADLEMIDKPFQNIEATYIQNYVNIVRELGNKVIRTSHTNKYKDTNEKKDGFITEAINYNGHVSNLSTLLANAPTSQDAFNKFESYLNNEFETGHKIMSNYRAKGFKGLHESVNVAFQNSYLFLMDSDIDVVSKTIDEKITDVLDDAVQETTEQGNILEENKIYPPLSEDQINDNQCK